MSVQIRDLTTKAMLVSLSISVWNIDKKDKQATQKLQEEFQSADFWARGTKKLASKAALAEINGVVSATRDFFRDNTRPWFDEGGYRILPSKNYLYLTGKIREFQTSFENAVNKLIDNYEDHKKEAEKMLGKLYNEQDYPDVAVLRSKYNFKVQVMPIPSENDFRVTQISDEDVAAIKKQVQDQMEEANRKLMSDLWERLYNVLNKAAEAFNDRDMKFHDSKIDNISETITILRRLNMDDDPKLERMCKQVEARICNLDPAEIRKQPAARQEAANDARKLLDAMSGYC